MLERNDDSLPLHSFFFLSHCHCMPLSARRNMDKLSTDLPHPTLQQLRVRLQNIYDAISNYQPAAARPPVLDSSLDVGTDTEDAQWLQQENIQGLKKLRDSIKIDLDVLEKVWICSNCAVFASSSLLNSFSSFLMTPNQ